MPHPFAWPALPAERVRLILPRHGAAEVLLDDAKPLATYELAANEEVLVEVAPGSFREVRAPDRRHAHPEQWCQGASEVVRVLLDAAAQVTIHFNSFDKFEVR